MRSPRHLWTGAWRDESEAARAAAGEAAAQRLSANRPPDEGEPGIEPPAPRRVWRPRPAIVSIAVIALVGVAFAAGELLHGGSKSPKTAAALPAVSSAPLKPRAGQTRATAIYAAASPAVVSVRSSQGTGTGFLVDTAGTVVTNDHVVGTDASVTVKFGTNGASINANVLGTDPSSDLAVLHVDPGSIPKDAKPLQFADSRGVQVGDEVVAIGNPFGLDRTETQGIVSALGRTIQAPNNFSIDNVIQTDAAINPGNSGGPLLDDAGHVVGVNAQIATSGTSNGNVGVGFAIPSNTVRQVVPQLRGGHTIARAYLGLQSAPVGSGFGNGGAQVGQVVPGGPAEQAGIQPGDVITQIDGKTVHNPDDVSSDVTTHKPGDIVPIQVVRGGSATILHAKLGTRPKTP
jgi:putative serine protease PepD